MNRRPQSLRDIVGQPAAMHLASYAQNIKNGSRDQKCWLLAGPSSTGKSSCALGLAAELGCHDQSTGLWVLNCLGLSVSRARLLFESTLQSPSLSETGMSCVILEQLDWIAPECERYLKAALDPLASMPKNLCVVATAEDTGSLQPWLVNRFRLLAFSSGDSFRDACHERLQSLWRATAGTEMPIGWTSWGVDVHTGQFSMRQATIGMEYWLDQRPAGVS